MIAYDFPPHAAVGTQRTLRLVRYLSETGWDVRVLTAEPASFRSDTPVDQRLLERVPASIRVLRASAWRPVDRVQRTVRTLLRRREADGVPGAAAAHPHSPSPPKARAATAIRRLVDVINTVSTIPDAEAGWILPAFFRGLSATRDWKPSVIYSSAPPWSGHLVALMLARRTRVPWVADFRDPWARAPWRSARTAPLGNNAAARLERLVVSRAAAVIVATMAAREEFRAHYGTSLADKFVLVPNGCDVSLFDGVTATPRTDMFVLLHAGSIYGGRSPSPVLRAASAAFQSGRIDRRRFRLRLVGGMSASAGEFQRTLDTLGLHDVVELVPRLSHRESLVEMASASALLLLQQGTGVSIPMKLYEYLAVGRPILALTESKEIESILHTSGTGVAILPENESAIEATLVSMSQGSFQSAVPPATMYDGRIRAAEAAAVLSRAIDGETYSSSDAPAPSLRTRREGSSHGI